MDSNIDYVDLLSKGENVWNKWRINNPDKTPCLRDINFVSEFSGCTFYDLPEFHGVDFSNVDFNSACRKAACQRNVLAGRKA